MSARLHNMELLSITRLGGSMAGGEGLAMHVASDGRRTLFAASERPPTDFVAMDVSDPRRPVVVHRRDLAGPGIRSNNLSIEGDLLAVTRQVNEPGATPAGVEFFDISNPSEPRAIGFFDASGEGSVGAHFVWLAHDGFAYLASAASNFVSRDQRDRFVLRIVDLKSPTHPVEVGQWWLPGLATSDESPSPVRPADRLAQSFGVPVSSEERALRRFEAGGLTSWDFGFRVHNISVLPENPNRAYVANTTGGAVVLDISDRSRPLVVSHLDYAVPLPCAAHTYVALGNSGFSLLSDETLEDAAADFPQNVWVVDTRVPSRPTIVGALDLPWPEVIPTTGRFGAHNLHEYPTGQGALRSFDFAAAAMFGLGVAVFDVADPMRTSMVAHFSPGPQTDGPGSGQLNDVFVDDRGILYALDRRSDYCFALELQM